MAKLMPGDKVTFMYERGHILCRSFRGRMLSRALNGELVFKNSSAQTGWRFRQTDEGVTWIRGWHDSNPAAIDALVAAHKLR